MYIPPLFTSADGRIAGLVASLCPTVVVFAAALLPHPMEPFEAEKTKSNAELLNLSCELSALRSPEPGHRFPPRSLLPTADMATPRLSLGVGGVHGLLDSVLWDGLSSEHP